MEFEPLFMKGLKLLQSNSKESLEELRQLYYDAVGKRRVCLKSSDLGFGFNDWVYVYQNNAF